MTIRGPSDATTTNQSGASLKRLGLNKLRALELIRQEVQTLSKYVQLNSDQFISNILRRQLIYTMLYVIEEYEFNSIASQQAILVLDFLKKAFSDEELEILKAFVKRNISTKPHLKLSSGRELNNSNLAALIKMALVLKAMTNNQSTDSTNSSPGKQFDP